MNNIVKKMGLGAVLAATVLGAAVPAQAQRWEGGYRHRGGGDAAGAALIGGIAGLAIGAAIASGNDRNRDYYYRERGYRPDYDAYYYRHHGYYPNNGYYADRYRDRGYYEDCWIERRWDPYLDRPVRVRICR